MPRKSMTFRLDEGLLARVDAAAAAAGVNRTAFVEGALEAALGGSPVVGSPGALVRPAQSGRSVGRAVSSAQAKRFVGPRWRGSEGTV